MPLFFIYGIGGKYVYNRRIWYAKNENIQIYNV